MASYLKEKRHHLSKNIFVLVHNLTIVYAKIPIPIR